MGTAGVALARDARLPDERLSRVAMRGSRPG
jgi:hypothetical protein